MLSHVRLVFGLSNSRVELECCCRSQRHAQAGRTAVCMLIHTALRQGIHCPSVMSLFRGRSVKIHENRCCHQVNLHQ